MLFYRYFEKWITDYKIGNIRNVTLQKYYSHLKSLTEIAKDVRLDELNRATYQNIINKYAETHEIITTRDFHTHLKSCILDALDEDLIAKDPTKKVVIKENSLKEKKQKKQKYLSQFESQCLIRTLRLENEINLDYLIFLLLKTGLRFSEAIALTPADFNYQKQSISISKTWNYKENAGFDLTKNKSSIREVCLDLQTFQKFTKIIQDIPSNEPIFMYGRKCYNLHNSVLNDHLTQKCKEAKIPIIGVHGLRHTHASLLLASGVTVASVSKRLGHSNMATTQKVYLHIIKELENKDNALALAAMMNLGG